MKRIFILLIAGAGLVVVSASAQSLGDVARQNRAAKKPSTGPKTVIDNDMIPSAIIPAETPKEKAEAEAEAKKEGGKEESGKEEKKEGAKKDPAEIKKAIEAEKREITQLQRELDVAEREAKLRAAAFYADAGTMLRDQAKFAEETRNTQAEIDGKKQALEAAKQKLSDLQEEARKAGVPSGQVE